MMRRRALKIDRYTAMRRRLIRETELGLLAALQNPKGTTRIPTVEVGTAVFDARFASKFWEQTLGLDESWRCVFESFAERVA